MWWWLHWRSLAIIVIHRSWVASILCTLPPSVVRHNPLTLRLTMLLPRVRLLLHLLLHLLHVQAHKNSPTREWRFAAAQTSASAGSVRAKQPSRKLYCWWRWCWRPIQISLALRVGRRLCLATWSYDFGCAAQVQLDLARMGPFVSKGGCLKCSCGESVGVGVCCCC